MNGSKLPMDVVRVSRPKTLTQLHLGIVKMYIQGEHN